MRIRYPLVNYLVLFSLCCLIECASSVKSSTSRETNWLKTCKTDQQCEEGMNCFCGVCSTKCKSTGDCKKLDERSTCAAASQVSITPACEEENIAGSTSLCVLPCMENDDCVEASDTQLECYSNYCIDKRFNAEPEEPSTDSGVLDGGSLDDVADDTGIGTTRPDCDEEGQCEGEMVCHLDNTCIERGVFDENGFATLAVAPGQIEYIAVDDTHIYWTQRGTGDSLGNDQDDGAIVRMAIEGGPITPIAAFQRRPKHILADDTQLYWVNYNLADDSFDADKSIIRSTKNGSASPEAIVENVNYYFGSLTQDEVYLYFLDWDRGPCRVKKDGTGEVELLADELTPSSDYKVSSLVLDNDAVYLGHDTGVFKISLISLEYSDLVDNPGEMNGESVFYVDNGYLFYSVFMGTEVRKIPTTGGEPTTVLVAAPQVGSEIVIQELRVLDDYFYYYRQDPGYIEIGRAPVKPGENELIVTAGTTRSDNYQGGESVDLEVTDKGLFWSQFKDAIPSGRITRFDPSYSLSH